MTFDKRLTKLLNYELKQGTDITTSNFKLILDRLAIEHCSLEHLDGEEMSEVLKYKNLIWSNIQNGKILIEYITEEKITLPSFNL